MGCVLLSDAGGLSPSAVRLLSDAANFAINEYDAQIGVNEIMFVYSGEGENYCTEENGYAGHATGWSLIIDGSVKPLKFVSACGGTCAPPCVPCIYGDIQHLCCECGEGIPGPQCSAGICCLYCQDLGPLEDFQPDDIYADELSCTFGFPIGSEFVPGPQPEEDDYNWEWDNVDCQVASLPPQTIELYPSQVLDNLMNAICCSPRPCYLQCTNYNEELVAEPYMFSVQFRLELYFPIISGSHPRFEGERLNVFCYGRQYSFVYSAVDILIEQNEWQKNIWDFVQNFNAISSDKLKIMLGGYGMVINTQNGGVPPLEGRLCVNSETANRKDNYDFSVIFNNESVDVS